MRITKPLVGLGIAAAVALLAGCTSGPAAEPIATTTAKPADLRVWFMQDSIPATAQSYLEQEFAKENPGSTLTIQVQQWNGIAQKLQTSLPSSDQTPDLVETGNTQTTIFSSVNAFSDLTDQKAALGGKQLIQSFTNSATWNGKLYGVPLYAGSRTVYYRKDLFEKAGISVPKTIPELQAAIRALGAANPDGTAGFSPIYLSANDVHAPESWLFANGGNYAVQKNGKWVGDLSSAASQRGLKQIQDVFAHETTYGLDSTAAANGMYNLFNSGKVGMMVGTLNVSTKISADLMDSGKVGMFAFPGTKAGTPGSVFAGGSNVSISRASKNQTLARDALKLIMGKTFQSMIAKNGGWVPGNTQYASALTGPFAEQAKQAVVHSTLTPNTPQWGVAVANNVLPELYTRIAKGEDTATVAKDIDTKLESFLNTK